MHVAKAIALVFAVNSVYVAQTSDHLNGTFRCLMFWGFYMSTKRLLLYRTAYL